MKEFWIKINYADKSFENKKIKSVDNITALTHVLNSLSLTEKDKVLGVKIFNVNE